MAKRPERILRPAQRRYLDRLLSPRDPLLRELESRRGIAPRDPAVLRLLEVLAAFGKPGRVLDLAVGEGDATLALARGAPQAQLVALARDAESGARARELWQKGLVADRIALEVGEPLALAAGLTGPFDLIHLDGSAAEARYLLDGLLPQLAVRGLVVVENLLAHGRLADPAPEDLDDPALRTVSLFNPYLMIHPQLRAVLLPLANGVALASKSRPLIRELGGPF